MEITKLVKLPELPYLQRPVEINVNEELEKHKHKFTINFTGSEAFYK